jgi:D-aminoacyl-tRNA deacylase
MIGLLQRVTQAKVTIDGDTIASINTGLLVLVGVEKNDSEKHAQRLFEKLIAYRIFPDDQDKMNLSLQDINGDLLLVPQFTLAADTQKGLRPSFSNAAPPDLGKQLFEYLIDYARQHFTNIETGVFGADMQVSLNNDGPVTFWLQS